MLKNKNSVCRPKRAIKRTIGGYSRQTTVHGINYISNSSGFPLDRLLWLFVCIIFAALAIALSLKAYIEWQEDPVLTSVKTTG